MDMTSFLIYLVIGAAAGWLAGTINSPESINKGDAI
jgi:uncharacterized membrane protein YeaQ/YmgE (transglycosylase-associated protein family)